MLISLAPSGTADACSIAVVGGGATGALMTAHLLKGAGDAVRVTLIEPRAQLGRGLAYATENESHRLNVRASNMSAFPDDPDHFWNWLRATGHRGEDHFCFLPRSVYGRYLGGLVEDRLAQTDPRRVRWLQDFVTGLSERDGSVTLRFSRSEPTVFDMAVLCCGHEASETLEAPFVSPWEDPRTWNAAPDSTILILGTGLTMVDAAIALNESGHRGAIVALSRRGLLPQARRRVEPAQITEKELPSPARLGSFLHWLRARAREEIQNGGDWRGVVDGLRPHVQAIWRAMPGRSRQRFLERARPWWDIHRHRMAPEVEGKIRALRESGQLRILSGHLLEVIAKREAERLDTPARVRGGGSAGGLPHRLIPRVDQRSTAQLQPSRRSTRRRRLCSRRSARHWPRRRQRLRCRRRARARFRANLRGGTDEPGRLLGIDRRP